MTALIAAVRAVGWRVWLALACAATLAWGADALRTHWMDAGRAEVQARWDAARMADQAASANSQAAAQAAARAAEQILTERNEEIDRAYTERETALRGRAAALDAELGRLRGAVVSARAGASAGSPGAAPAAAASGADGGAADAGELLLECSRAYADVAGAADGLASQVTGLQDWVRLVAAPDSVEAQ